jgi:fructose-1,6-bisphosphatase/inositol monophosphatase family enzyme
MTPQEILLVLREAATAVRGALETFDGAGLSGKRHGQYELDLVADAAAVDVLLGAGLAVFSEESGHQGEGAITVVVDPVDGSTNCDRGIPFYCVSLCALDGEGPLVGLVENLPVGTRYEAIRGEAAWRDGRVITTTDETDPTRAIVGVNGSLTMNFGWGQHRTLGAAALELCLVAEGALDAYLQAPGHAIHPWDYLAGVLIAEEAGATVVVPADEELVVLRPEPRRPVVAATPELAVALAAQVI